MNISVFGLGYVGCVSAACLARAGHLVVGVDVNTAKVEAVAAGRAPLVEPGLERLITRMVGEGRLSATTDVETAVRHADVALVCVGTPSAVHGRPDLGAVDRVIRQIGAAARQRARPLVVALRSTVPPGTIETRVWPALSVEAGDGASWLSVASNPEFMREGTSLRDFWRPPFVLIGASNEGTAATMRDVYARVPAPVVACDIRTSEMVKYACNAFHALKICFANEMGALCEVLSVDPQEMMRIFRMDHKLNVSEAYLRPGFAFGGSCLPKDLRTLLALARDRDLTVPLLGAIAPSNDARIQAAIDAVIAAGRQRVGVVGLTFKPNTDDVRESPVLRLLEALIGKGYDVRVLDTGLSLPRMVGSNRRVIESQLPHVASLLCESADELAAHAEVIVVANAGEDAEQVLARTTDGQRLLNLTPQQLIGAARPMEEASWQSA